MTTRQAIADATANHNFDYDDKAYTKVKRNLSRLIKLGELPLVMELSLELMKQGSYQVEMSDEGLMTDDIEECLAPVGKAIKKSSLSPKQVLAWCAAMDNNDNVGFIYNDELEALRKWAETSAT